MMIRRRLSAVKCGTCASFPLGTMFGSTICCIVILRRRGKKGNGTPAPPSARLIADQAQFWLTQFHEILTKKTVLERLMHFSPSFMLRGRIASQKSSFLRFKHLFSSDSVL